MKLSESAPKIVLIIIAIAAIAIAIVFIIIIINTCCYFNIIVYKMYINFDFLGIKSVKQLINLSNILDRKLDMKRYS
jgi:hypothetical protein